MIKNLLKWGLFLLAGILIYNYFYGTAEEKEQSKEFFQEIKDLGASAWNLLKAEKEKLDEGKYDEALSDMENLFNALRDKVEAGGEAMSRINQLEAERRNLEDRLQRVDTAEETQNLRSAEPNQEQQQLREDIKKLFEKTENLMRDMEQQ